MGKIRIIITDDHTLVRETLRVCLEQREHFTVIAAAGSGEELLDLLEDTDADLLLMDITLPGMTGLEAAKIIRKKDKKIKIIMLTMQESKLLVKEALHIQANGFLYKYAGFEVLVDAIFSVMGGNLVYDQKVRDMLAASSNGDETAIGADVKKKILTRQEFKILTLLAEGHTSSQIAEKLNISTHTVNNHRQKILKKFGVKKTTVLIQYAHSLGIL